MTASAVMRDSPTLKPMLLRVSVVCSSKPKIDSAAMAHVTTAKKLRMAVFRINCTTMRMIIHASNSFVIPWPRVVFMPTNSELAMTRLAYKIRSAMHGQRSFIVLVAISRTVAGRSAPSSIFVSFLRMTG